MKRSLGRWWCVALGVVAFGAPACGGSGSGSSATASASSTSSLSSRFSGLFGSRPRTTLELTLHGGFAYVLGSGFTVEAGFMKSIDEGAGKCQVTQLGVDLKIDDGQITSPSGWPMVFPVQDYVITFDGIGTDEVRLDGALESSLKGTNTTTPPAAAAANGPGGPRPNPRATDKQWNDIFWVSHTRLNFFTVFIDDDWRTKAVTGRVVMAGGTLSAGMPSDGAAVNGMWEFRSKNGAKAQKHAITDRLHYATTINAKEITITLTPKVGVATKVVVTPVDGRKTVGLVLMGRHASTMPINVGDPIDHFCTFYQIIKADRRPAYEDLLIPYYVGDGREAVGAAPPADQPTPGAFCPGDWP